MASQEQRVKITDEELLEAIKTGDSTEVLPDFVTDISLFINIYNIQPGDELVKKQSLYLLYKKWSKNPATQGQFLKEVGKLLVTKYRKYETYYLININPLKIYNMLYKLIGKTKLSRTKIPSYQNLFERFLNTYSIRRGDMPIEAFVLYYLYDRWLFKRKSKTRLSYNQFIKFCNLYFTEKVNANQVVWYCIDPILTKYIHPKVIEEVRQGRMFNASKAKKQKRKKQISST